MGAMSEPPEPEEDLRRESLRQFLDEEPDDRSSYPRLMARVQAWLDANPDEGSKPRREEETREATQWLLDKWGDERPCPYCGNEHYFVAPPNSFAADPAGATSPYVPVICSNCGVTVFID